jgi:hypothetical protein
MQIINHITMLSIILTGAALIREREHGTIEHLLVMPVPDRDHAVQGLVDGLVVLVAAALSLNLCRRLTCQEARCRCSSPARRCACSPPRRWASSPRWRATCRSSAC